MKIIVQQAFTQDVDIIYTSYLNQDFIEKKIDALGGRDISVSIEEDEESTTVTSWKEMPMQVPGPLSKWIKPWSKVKQTEIWTGEDGGPYYCDLTIEVDGAPISIQSQIKLASTEEGAAAASVTEVACTIPFIGKAVNGFLREVSEQAVKEEFKYIEDNT